MKLTSITVGNYKNIEETKLDLGAIIAMVSPNNYGKSNLLEAFRFAFDFMDASPKSRTSMMHWVRAMPLSPALAGKDFIFSIEFDAPELSEYRFVRYSFRFAWYNDQGDGATITDETIEIRNSDKIRYTTYLKRSKGQYRPGKSKSGFRKIVLAKDVLAIDVLSSLEDIEISDVVSKIKSLTVQMCNTLELDSSFQPNPIEFDIGNSSAVMFNDDDIPKALKLLKDREPEKFDLFTEIVYDLFPEFTNIELREYALKESSRTKVQAAGVPLDSDTQQPSQIPYHIKTELYRLFIESEHLNQPISMEYMSTGTKRIIWLIANAIYGNCYGTNLIGVDEIETSIHPKMIRNLLESLTSVLDDTSMIVTSHSPYIIQYLHPERLYVGVPNNNGVAKFRKIQPSKVKALIKTSRELGSSIGEYLFELMAGDEDSASILSAYLED